MKSNLLISFLLILCCFLISCHSSRLTKEEHLQTSPIEFDKITTDSVFKRITINQDIPFITAKGHVHYLSKNENLDGNITIYAIKDSVYLVNIKKIGIELFRILITKDSFKILDRIDQSYSIIPMTELISKYRIPLDFTNIYQILSSGCFLDSTMYYEFKKDDKQCALYGISEFQTLNYQLDTFRLLPYLFEAIYEHQLLHLEVQNTKNYSGKWIPSQFNLKVDNSDDQIMYIQIRWDELKIEPITSLKFNIPAYYTRIGK